jgi:hypothetical protein
VVDELITFVKDDVVVDGEVVSGATTGSFRPFRYSAGEVHGATRARDIGR